MTNCTKSTMLLSCALAGLLSCLAVPVRAGDEKEVAWRHDYQVDEYWVVRRVHFTQEPENPPPVPDGYYYTRFLVTGFPSPSGKPRLAVQVRAGGFDAAWAHTADRAPQEVELYFERDSMLMKEYQIGRADDLDPETWGRDMASGPLHTAREGALGPGVFLETGWLMEAGSVVLWPTFRASGTPGTYLLRSESIVGERLDGTETVAVRQVVTQLDGGEILVEFWRGPGADRMLPEQRLPWSLRFRPRMPWPDVLDGDGNVHTEVVETGILKPQRPEIPEGTPVLTPQGPVPYKPRP